jgi:hypothetical protein
MARSLLFSIISVAIWPVVCPVPFAFPETLIPGSWACEKTDKQIMEKTIEALNRASMIETFWDSANTHTPVTGMSWYQ